MSDDVGGTWLEDGKMIKASERKQPRGLQFVWWGRENWTFWFVRFDVDQTDWAYIYEWRLILGPLEIRRWAEPFDIVKARRTKRD